MKRPSLEGVYEYGLLGVLLLLVVHAPISVALGTLLPQYAEGIKAWKEIALAVLAIGALILIVRNRLWNAFFKNKIVVLCIAFIVLHLFIAFFTRSDLKVVTVGLMIDLRFIVMLLLMYVLLLVRPFAMKQVVYTVAAGASVVIGFGLLQILVLPDDILTHIGYSRETIAPYVTIDSNPEFVRINSTLRGPNPLGALMVIYLAVAIAYVVSKKTTSKSQRRLMTASAIGSIVVLIASFSRSAYIAAVIAVGIVIASSLQLTKRLFIWLSAGLVVVGIGLLLVSTTDWFSNVVLHEDPESTVVEKSNDGHVESLVEGTGRVANRPLGAGIGSTGSATLYDATPSNDVIIENYYVFVAHEAGWLGGVLFIVLFGLLIFELWRQRADWIARGMFASGVGLAVAAIFLPVWADETVALIWWGMAGAVFAAQRGIIASSHAATRQQKATRTP